MKRLVMICVAFVTAGCSTVEQPAYDYRSIQLPPDRPPLVISVISDPPAARIEVNDNYIGVTPCEITAEFRADSLLKHGPLHIRALPTQAGQYVQEKVLQYDRENMPKTVFFDMYLHSTNLNITLR